MNETIKREAMALPPDERAKLADALMSSLDDAESRAIEAKWAREADARLVAYRAGKLAARNGADVLSELRQRYGR